MGEKTGTVYEIQEQTESQENQPISTRLASLQDLLNLFEPPQRMECFDVSHLQGEATVVSCVVFEGAQPAKTLYRRFNIKNSAPGDDCFALKVALVRRYTRLQREEGALPDIIFVDGGEGQWRSAHAVLEELQIEDILLIGIAKGEGQRDAESVRGGNGLGFLPFHRLGPLF